MAGGRPRPGDAQPLRRGAGAARARRRLRLARPRDVGRCAGSASRRTHLDRPLRTFSGGELTRASLARALGGDPDLLLLDEPTNHLDVASLEWLERELQSLDAAVILVAHDRWFLEAVTTATLEVVAGRGTFFPGPWHEWRREKAARMLHAQKEVAARPERHRAARALRRALPLQEGQGEAGAGEADADRPPREGARRTRRPRSRSSRASTRTLGFEFLKPARSGRIVVEAEGLERRDRRPRAAATTRRSRSSAASTSRSSGRTAPARRRCSRRLVDARRGRHPHRARRRGRLLLAAGDGARHARLRAPVRADDDRALAAGRAEPARQVPLLRLGRAREGGRRAVGRRAAAARARGDGRVRRELPRARRADEPPRPREPRGARGGARRVPGTVLLVSHDRALLDAIAERTLAIEDGELHAYDGGWAEMLRRREERARARRAAEPKVKRKREPKPRPKRPTELERIESEIAVREAEVRRSRRSSPRTGPTSRRSPRTRLARRARSAARALGAALRSGVTRAASRNRG